MRNLIAPVALAAGLMLGSAALAATPQAATATAELTASAAPGVQEVVVGRSTIGAPIEQITVSRPLSYVGLNLTNPADVRLIDRQIQDTAEKECAELRDQSNDLRNPTIAGGYCVRSAAREARSTLSAAVSGAKALQ
jgi:UrcA family protein